MNLFKRKKYLSHTYQYKVDGEKLPKRGISKKTILLLLISSLFLFFIINLILNVFKTLLISIFSLFSESSNSKEIEQASILESAFSFGFSISVYAFIYLLILLFVYMAYQKFSYGSEEQVAYGQKGDSRLTTIKELLNQYPKIPEKEIEFEGVGGIPISHYKSDYFIDTDTVNSCIVGVSRSGKGEMVVVPMIDNLSRAKVKSSMVINDPKGELFAASKETLEKRGYRVEILNIQDPSQSMSYNPLSLVIEAFKRGDIEEASKRATAITYSIYHSEDSGENTWVYEGAQSAITAIILALTEHCIREGEPEKISLSNVSDMLNELGTFYYTDTQRREYNALDEFFKSLPQGHIAKKRYGSTSFSGDKARGSILSTANQGLDPFIESKFAKMTMFNSLDLKTVGFPKNLNGQIDSIYINLKILISFHRNDEKKTLINEYSVKVKDLGMFYLNFDDDLKEGDLILIRGNHEKSMLKAIYQIKFNAAYDENGNIVYKKENGKESEIEKSEKVELIPKTQQAKKLVLNLNYSNKPTAIFMAIPDFDASNHALASIFTSQLYTELAANCMETKDKKTFKRVHFILDEFGNMPAISDMDKIATVCAGRNILLTLIVQSYSQFFKALGDNSGGIVKDNCQNHIYIISTNEDTIEEVSKRVGSTTNIGMNSTSKHLDMDNSVTRLTSEDRLITPERVRQLLEGESIVIRSLHRKDLSNKKVRPYPIFNTEETIMPYRHEFLSEWFDTGNDINDISISSLHSKLDLKDFKIDFGKFINISDVREMYYAQYEDNKDRLDSESISVEPITTTTEENVTDEYTSFMFFENLELALIEESRLINTTINELLDQCISDFHDYANEMSKEVAIHILQAIVNTKTPGVQNCLKIYIQFLNKEG